MDEENTPQTPKAAPDPETGGQPPASNPPSQSATTAGNPAPEKKENGVPPSFDFIKYLIGLPAIVGGLLSTSVTGETTTRYIWAIVFLAFGLLFFRLMPWKISRGWIYTGMLGVILASVGLCGWAYYDSQPHFTIEALNTLKGDTNVYEITDYLIWNRLPDQLDAYSVKTNFEIQIVPTYGSKDRLGEVVVRISSAPDSDIYYQETLWPDFDSSAETKKITISLKDLIEFSGIQESYGLENRLDKFSYRESKLYVQILPVTAQKGDAPWATQIINIRNAPWDQRIDVVGRNKRKELDVYLKNYGAAGDFFTHYKLVRLDDLGATPLTHSTNSGTTRIESGSGIWTIDSTAWQSDKSTTFSIPLPESLDPGRYAIEVYTVKKQRYLNWDVAYGNASWWFGPGSQIAYFAVKTPDGQANVPATPFEAEAARLKAEQNINLGVPTGPVQDITSRHDVPGQRQEFTNGLVIIYNDQAYSMYGPIYRHYKALENGSFPTSQITTIQRGNDDAVDMMEFEPVGESDMASVIYANDRYAAWVEGWVRRVYEDSDGVNGWLGLPVSDLMYHADSNTQAFENGYIVYYFPKVNGERDYNRRPVILPYVTTLGANGEIFDVKSASWQDTGIEIQEGDLVWVEYIGGTWTDSTETNPDGYSAGGNSVLRYVEGTITDKAMLGTLIARVGGENQPIFTIGRWAVFVAPSSGKLELAMNDSSYEHNAGSVTVKIDITPK